MRPALLLLALAASAWPDAARFELRGRLAPPAAASVWVQSVSSPFEDSTRAGEDGRFRFRALPSGTYVLAAFVPGRGEGRRSIEVGPSQADSKRRIALVVELHDEQFDSRDSLRREALTSVKELTISPQAWREYDQGRQRLAKPDVAGAIAHFQRAVEIPPGFTAAWNYLGTIAYQTRDYTHAEDCFRKALQAGPETFEPLVNLGGVLLNLGKYDEALPYNRHAVLTRPNDALANSQLGLNYFYLDRLEQGRKYLTIAERIDPGHFTQPQLTLAEICVRRHEPAAAAAELESFLKHHPDAPGADGIRLRIVQLRGGTRAE